MNIDFREAALAIERVIAFAKMLPNKDNGTNVRCWIWKWQTQQAELCGSLMMSQALLPLPHPGTNMFRPPMLHKQPPHLNLAILHPNLASPH